MNSLLSAIFNKILC